MIITLEHLHSVPTWTTRQGYCANSSRLFFKQYGLDWQDFINNGINEEELLATGNALAIHLVEHAHQQSAGLTGIELAQALEEFNNGR